MTARKVGLCYSQDRRRGISIKNLDSQNENYEMNPHRLQFLERPTWIEGMEIREWVNFLKGKSA